MLHGYLFSLSIINLPKALWFKFFWLVHELKILMFFYTYIYVLILILCLLFISILPGKATKLIEENKAVKYQMIAKQG